MVRVNRLQYKRKKSKIAVAVRLQDCSTEHTVAVDAFGFEYSVGNILSCIHYNFPLKRSALPEVCTAV